MAVGLALWLLPLPWPVVSACLVWPAAVALSSCPAAVAVAPARLRMGARLRRTPAADPPHLPPLLTAPPRSWPPAACLPFFRSVVPSPARGCIPAQPAHLAAGKGFSRPVWYLDSLWFMPPYNPPKHSILHRKSPRKIVQKNFPNSPVGGNGGTVFGLLTARKKPAIIRGKRRPHGHRPANRRRPHGRGDQEGGR